MAFSQNFLYRAIDKITPTLKRIDKVNKKTAKTTEKAFAKVDKGAKKAEASTKKYAKATALADRKSTKFAKTLSKVGTKLKSVGKSFMKFATLPIIALGTAAIFAGGNYEASLLSLSAITGVTGKTLDELSVKILESSEKWNIGASKFAKGMELIGSKQPVLLKTPALLLEVTNAAALMSKAAGQEFPVAAENLLSIMNAFEIEGKDALKTVNMLAAASKFGAAQIPAISEAIKRAAGGAKVAKVGLAEVTAAVEILAEKSGLPSTTIGIGLQNAFIKLESHASKKLRPSIVGLSGALINLNKANLSVTKLTKMFGQENIKTIVPLIANARAVAELTKKIQGTNVAVEQARINMGSFNELMKKLWVTIQNKLIKVFLKYKVEIKDFVLGTIDAVIATAAWIKANPKLTKTLIIMAAVIGPLLITIGVIASTISSIITIAPIVIGAIVGIKIAVIALGVGLTAIAPILIPILAIGAAIAGATLFVKWISEVTGLTNALSNLMLKMFNVEKLKAKGLDADKKAAKLAAFRIKLMDIVAIKNAKLRREKMAMLDTDRRTLVAQGVLKGKRTIEELVLQRRGLEGAGEVAKPAAAENKLDVNVNMNAPPGVIDSIKTKLKGAGNITVGQTLAGAA